MEVNTKFDIGDQVWFVEANKVVMRLITGLVIRLEGDTQEVMYSVTGSKDIPEDHLFKTKNELLESL
jgi:hypothetical protein